MRTHFVTFVSPGTFFSEQTTKPIGSWDVPRAVKMAADVLERYDALPYGFYFAACLVSDPVPDGEGGLLSVRPKEVERSGMYFLGGRLLTLDDVKARNNPQYRILVSNMESNGWPIVIENTNSWRVTQPFTEKDCVVDGDGRIVERGDDPARVEYRQKKIEEHRRSMEAAEAPKES